MTTFLQYYYLKEALKDISTENKLYHQTNAYSLFKILESGYLSPKIFKFNTNNMRDFYSNEEGNKELAVGRASLYNKMNRLKGETKEQFLRNLPNFGGVKFELYKDRLKTGNISKGLKIEPYARFSVSGRQELKSIIDKYNSISKQEIEKIITSYEDIFFAPNHVKKEKYIKVGALKQTFPFMNKITFSDFDKLIKALYSIHYYRVNPESEERLVFTGKNKIEKNELFSVYNDRLYLNSDYLKIILLPNFFEDFIKNISPHSFIKYYNKMKQWRNLFENNTEYKKFAQFLRDFANGKVDDEIILKQVDKKRIEDYLKSSGRKTFIPSSEERAEEKKKYNYKTGGKKISKEEILANWNSRKS